MEIFRILSSGAYNALYLGGFALALCIAAWEGRRRGVPMAPWLVLLAALVAGGIAGSKVLHFDLHLAEAGEKTILGGIAGALLTLLVARRLLRLPAWSIRILPPAALVGFALGRIGCFLSGCCFGRPTELAWGVRYEPGTEPFAAQVEAGLIAPSAQQSLAVHPTQIVEAALALLLAELLRRHGDRFRSSWSPVLGLGVGYGAIRFGVEFLRWGGDVSLGLKTVQWTVLVATVALAALLFWMEARSRHRPRAAGELETWTFDRPLWWVAIPGFALLAITTGSDWFTPLERLTLLLAVLPAVGGTLWLSSRSIRWTGAPVAAVAVLTFTPQVHPDTVPAYPYHFYTVGGGGATGSYVESCGGRRRYTMGGASLGYTRVVSPDTRYSFDGAIFGGRDELASRDNPGNQDDHTLAGLSVFGQIDAGWVGFGLGGMAGRMVLDGEVTEPVLPSAMLRLGRADGFFLDGRVLRRLPAALPAPAIQLGLGAAVSETGSTARLGFSDAGFFVAGNLVTPQGLEFDPFVAVGDSETYYLGLTVRQRFGLGPVR
jgi:prolipoprotein diacylglyceryltransferase